MSKSRMIIQRIIMVVALIYIAVGIINKDYVTLWEAIGIYIFELLIMNWNKKNKNKEEHEISENLSCAK